jgi:hypothetical protein
MEAAAPPGLAAAGHRSISPSYSWQWSGPPTVVTNLGFAVALFAVAGRLILILHVANAGIGRGRVLSCNSNLRVPCIGFESILLGCTIL